ncbi:MAG: NAD-dependent epimerase/dehydratase family protein [Bacilli bacterium]|nr:NAD-dependent epimerase/dehydratase family protein [Bacilli bacterium]
MITGADSYIGTSVEKWLAKQSDFFCVDTIDMKNDDWRNNSFSKYDVIFHVAGIAHDLVKKKNDNLYYRVNRDLALEVADKAKAEGVKQFIFMSSMGVYNASKVNFITNYTVPRAKNAYDNSKLQADLHLQKLNSNFFKVVIIRPPMIFGPGCKGNFNKLVRIVYKFNFFPKFKNARSMLYIDNLCEFVRLVIISEKNGVYFPQNENYYSTSEVVKLIADAANKKMHFTIFGNWLIYCLMPFINSLSKAFGTLVYDQEISNVFDKKYIIIGNKEAVYRSIKK